MNKSEQIEKNSEKEKFLKYIIKDGKCELKEYHTKKCLKKIKETISKEKEIVFILPNGREVKYE